MTGLEIVLAMLLTTLQLTPGLVGIVVSCGLCRAATDVFVLRGEAVELKFF